MKDALCDNRKNDIFSAIRCPSNSIGIDKWIEYEQ